MEQKPIIFDGKTAAWFAGYMLYMMSSMGVIKLPETPEDSTTAIMILVEDFVMFLDRNREFFEQNETSWTAIPTTKSPLQSTAPSSTTTKKPNDPNMN